MTVATGPVTIQFLPETTLIFKPNSITLRMTVFATGPVTIQFLPETTLIFKPNSITYTFSVEKESPGLHFLILLKYATNSFNSSKICKVTRFFLKLVFFGA